VSTLLLARIVSLPCPRPSTVLLGRVIEEATVPPFFRGKNGNAAAPVVMAAEGAWLCIPIWTTPRGREEELLQARRAVFTSTGQQNSSPQFKHDPQPPEAPLFWLPRGRAFTRDAFIKILKSRLPNAGMPSELQELWFPLRSSTVGSRVMGSLKTRYSS